MPLYLVSWKFAPQSLDRMIETPVERETSAKAHARSFGGTLQSYYFTIGDWHACAILDFPSSVDVAAMCMKTMATGGYADYAITPLLSAAESEAVLARAHEVTSIIRPPNL